MAKPDIHYRGEIDRKTLAWLEKFGYEGSDLMLDVKSNQLYILNEVDENSHHPDDRNAIMFEKHYTESV